MSEQRRDVDFHQATFKGNVLGGGANSLFTSIRGKSFADKGSVLQRGRLLEAGEYLSRIS